MCGQITLEQMRMISEELWADNNETEQHNDF